MSLAAATRKAAAWDAEQSRKIKASKMEPLKALLVIRKPSIHLSESQARVS